MKMFLKKGVSRNCVTLTPQDKYTCKIDDHQFNSESMLISHMRQSHRNTIEEMLHVLAAEGISSDLTQVSNVLR